MRIFTLSLTALNTLSISFIGYKLIDLDNKFFNEILNFKLDFDKKNLPLPLPTGNVNHAVSSSNASLFGSLSSLAVNSILASQSKWLLLIPVGYMLKQSYKWLSVPFRVQNINQNIQASTQATQQFIADSNDYLDDLRDNNNVTTAVMTAQSRLIETILSVVVTQQNLIASQRPQIVSLISDLSGLSEAVEILYTTMYVPPPPPNPNTNSNSSTGIVAAFVRNLYGSNNNNNNNNNNIN